MEVKGRERVAQYIDFQILTSTHAQTETHIHAHKYIHKHMNINNCTYSHTLKMTLTPPPTLCILAPSLLRCEVKGGSGELGGRGGGLVVILSL